MLRNKTLSSLALLKVYMSKNKDYLDLLLPYVEYVLASLSTEKPFDIHDVKVALKSEFGLVIPDTAIDLILKRVKRQGKLKAMRGLYYKVGKFQPSSEFENRRRTFGEQQTYLISELSKFAAENFKLGWTDAEAIDALLKYINHYGISSINAYINKTALPEQIKAPTHALYIVRKFLNHLRSNETHLFEIAMDMIKGAMIMNALLCDDLQSHKHYFRSTTFYLDTDILLTVTGMDGEEHEIPAKELINLLRSQKAKLATFDHICDEAMNVLVEVESRLINNQVGYGSAYDYFSQYEDGISRIAQARGEFMARLAGLQIDIVSHSEYNNGRERIAQVDENLLEETIRKFISYKKDSTLARDIKSIRNVYAIRERRRPLSLENANAVFVTSNTRLCKGVTEYGVKYESSDEVSPAITAYELTVLSWLKSPTQISDIPEHLVISDCMAILNLPDDTWDSFAKEVEIAEQNGIIPGDSLLYLRNSRKVREELADATFGGALSPKGNVFATVIAHVEEEIARPHKQESKKWERQYNQQLNINMRVTEKVSQLASFVSFTITSLLFVIVCISLTYLTVIGVRPDLGYPTTFGLVLAGTASVITLASFFFGGDMSTFTRKFYSMLKNRIYIVLSSMIGVPDELR